MWPQYVSYFLGGPSGPQKKSGYCRLQRNAKNDDRSTFQRADGLQNAKLTQKNSQRVRRLRLPEDVSMEMKPGSRWKSAVCSTEVVVVRPPNVDVSLECGGIPMVAQSATAPSQQPVTADLMKGSLVGKRYVDGDTSIELLCVKTGEGSLSVNQRLLAVKDAKRLPSSD